MSDKPGVKTPILFILLWALGAPAADAPRGTASELLKNPLVSRAKEECEAAYDETDKKYRLNGTHKDIGECMWAGLSEAEREQIKKSLGGEQQAQLSPTITESFHRPLSPAERKALDGLRKHFKKKLSEAIRAGFDDGKPVFINPKTIYDLYEQRVGKSVIEATTSFCFEAELVEGEKYKIEEHDRQKRRKVRENRLQALQVPSNGAGGEQVVAAFKPWSECIVSIAPACFKEGEEAKAADPYTRKRSCEVVNYLQAMKKALKATKEIKKALSESIAKASFDLDINVYSGGGHPGGVGTNEATTITSRDIAQSQYQQEADALREQLEECKKNGSGKSLECENVLVGQEEGRQAQDEAAAIALATKAKREKMEEFIEEAQNVDGLIDEELKKIGIDEEGKEEYLEKLGIEEPKDILKKLTLDRYDAERETLVTSLQERLDKRIKKTEEEGANQGITTLGEELAANVEEYKQLLHFNNVVSSFLDVKSADGQSFRNTSALVLELENDAFGELEEEDRGEDNERWGKVDYKTGQSLLELKDQIEKRDDAPVLSEEEIDQLLGGDDHPSREELENGATNPLQ